ncbi:MAG TPA: amidohydrolase family protein, partial [Chloroflexota bacterium]|nr:amidohydrolase family protein [Chloroflexota bacterium]
LREAVQDMWVLDAHEHLYLPEQHAEKALDCFYLTSHYLNADLIAAGMPEAEMKALEDQNIPLEQRWRMFAPYWEFARTTGYGHAVQLAACELYGVAGLDEQTYADLSEKVAAGAKQSDWYEHVLKEHGRFIGCLADIWSTRGDRRYFLPVMRFDELIMAHTREDIQRRKECEGNEVAHLAGYLACLDGAFQRYVEAGVVAIKCGLAYRRTLHFEVVTRDEAERFFDRALAGELSASEAKPLQDFLFHEVCERARAHGLPYQIHTGYLAGNANVDVPRTNPALLSNTLKTHPETRFDLFHGGYPYGGETAALAKNYPNAYINACWLAILSPTVLRRQLHEWLDTVPHNKIQAFGGDYRMPELSYAHSLMAREAVADVLAERVELGLLPEHDAPVLARRLLAENGIAFFKLSPEHVAEATTLRTQSRNS